MPAIKKPAPKPKQKAQPTPVTKSKPAAGGPSRKVINDTEVQLQKRTELVEKLTVAAQIEHDVMVQYLFAAFSLKKQISEGGVNHRQLDMMRDWATSMLVVARQEMEHLGYVSNMLLAVGEAPMLQRPAIPNRGRPFQLKNFDSSLDKFSLDTVFRFFCYEVPNVLPPAMKKELETMRPGLKFNPADYDDIFKTYQAIERLFDEIQDDYLFIGAPSAQFITGGNATLIPRGRSYPEKPTDPIPFYDMYMGAVTDKKTAKQAIQQITEEGEGIGQVKPGVVPHFQRFFDIYKSLDTELKNDPSFQPARDVVSNPYTLDVDPASPPVNYVTNPDTKKVMQLFDQTYKTMLLMLMRFFANADESSDDLLGLQNLIFFPMMTMGIRPLAEVLTRLPAHTSGTLRAGPSFTIPRSVQLLPHRKSAWRAILGEFQLMTAYADDARQIPRFDKDVQQRLQFIYENLMRMQMNFQDAMHARSLK